MMQKAIHLVQRDVSIWASLFLLCLFAIGARTGITFDLLFVAVAGFYLSARWHIRGFCYALALLCVDAVARHGFLVSDHLFQLGLEGSLACTFFITALAFEQGSGLIDSLTAQIETRETALDNLEEDLNKVQQESLTLQIAFQEKAAQLQKELEELQTEHSSILILNEVLRKTTARHAQENSAITAKLLDADRKIGQLKAEYEECQKDLFRVTDSDKMAIANAELMRELNQARYDKEQTHLINETLARLYMRESLKAKEADVEASSLKEQLTSARKEGVRVQPLPEVKPQEILQDSSVKEELNAAYEKITELMQVEPQLRQLKQQFEEKNRVLHQVRADLFKADTEIQRLQMEKAALELHPVPKEVERELDLLNQELLAQEVENQELQELISILNESTEDAAKRKKKVKIRSKDTAQEFLF